jgi:hypothetical protein
MYMQMKSSDAADTTSAVKADNVLASESGRDAGGGDAINEEMTGECLLELVIQGR